MMIVIRTQFHENYGAHDWDGVGECPQYWKAKGGSEYKILDIPLNIDYNGCVAFALTGIESDNEYSREYMIDRPEGHREDDGDRRRNVPQAAG